MKKFKKVFKGYVEKLLFLFWLFVLADAYSEYCFDLKDVVMISKDNNRFIYVYLSGDRLIHTDYYAGKDTCNQKYAELKGAWEDYKKCITFTKK